MSASPPFYYTTRTKRVLSHSQPRYPFSPSDQGSKSQRLSTREYHAPTFTFWSTPVISVKADKYCPHLLCSGIYAISTKTRSSCAQNYRQWQPHNQSKVERIKGLKRRSAQIGDGVKPKSALINPNHKSALWALLPKSAKHRRYRQPQNWWFKHDHCPIIKA